MNQGKIRELIQLDEAIIGAATGLLAAHSQTEQKAKECILAVSVRADALRKEILSSLATEYLRPQPGLVDMAFEEAEQLSRSCAYASATVEYPDSRINWGDAAGFYLEGYLHARSLLAKANEEIACSTRG
jgi:hypothetical protein